jgi:hypothetical protein
VILHAAAALFLAIDLSLVGFAAMPARLVPRRARHVLPASLSLGALLFGWSAFLAGTFLGTRTILPLLVMATALALVRARAWGAMTRRALRDVAALAAANPLATAATVIVAALILPQLLLPVVDSDGLRYHLALPKLFAMTGSVSYYPWDISGALPQAAEMLYLTLLPAGGEAAKFLHALFFLATLPVVAMIAAAHPRTRPVAMLAPLLYAAAPVVLVPAGAAFIDHIAMFHIAVAALLLFRREAPLLAGISLGAALATKLTVAPAVAGLAILACTASAVDARRRAGRGRMVTALQIFAPIVIALAPFAIRAAVHTGDPIFPLGYTLLGRPIPGVTSDRARWAAELHSAAGGPLQIAWQAQPGVQSDEVAGLHHVVGLFAIALAFRDARTRRWLWLIVPSLLAALVFHPATRFFLTLFIGLALFEAAALARLPRLLATLAAIVAVVPASLSAAAVTFYQFAPSDYLLGRISRDMFLSSRLPAYRVTTFVNTLSPGGTVMALDFPTPFFFDRPFIVEGVLNDPPLAQWISDARTADDVLRRLHDHDVRLLVVTPGYGGGTPLALLPLAKNKREAIIVRTLRARLRLLRSIDGVDIVEVP